VGVDQIRQCSRMKRMENGADVESAQSEVCWARIQFNVTRKAEKGEEKRTAETECALASEEQKDCRLGRNAVGVLLEKHPPLPVQSNIDRPSIQGLSLSSTTQKPMAPSFAEQTTPKQNSGGYEETKTLLTVTAIGAGIIYYLSR